MKPLQKLSMLILTAARNSGRRGLYHLKDELDEFKKQNQFWESYVLSEVPLTTVHDRVNRNVQPKVLIDGKLVEVIEVELNKAPTATVMGVITFDGGEKIAANKVYMLGPKSFYEDEHNAAGGLSEFGHYIITGSGKNETHAAGKNEAHAAGKNEAKATGSGSGKNEAHAAGKNEAGVPYRRGGSGQDK